MKKLIAFIWLVIYTCVSTGFAVSTHFCMDKQLSVTLGAVEKAVCQKCGMQKKESHDCCRDEIKIVKLQQDTQVAQAIQPAFALSLPVTLVSEHLVPPFYNFTETGVRTSFQPPQLPCTDLNITNCVFRI